MFIMKLYHYRSAKLRW